MRNYAVATINGGAFTACDNYTNGGYAYAIANGNGDYPDAIMTINYATLYGNCNGLLASDGGTLVANDGSYTLGTNTVNSCYRIAYVSGNGSVIIEGGDYTRNVPNNNGFFGGSSSADGIVVNNGTFEDKRDGNGIHVDSGEATITGGQFNDALSKGTSATISVTGGTFKNDVTEYIPDGSTLIQNTDTGEVIVDKSKTAIARVDGIGFTDLASAIAAADDGDTVTLLANVPEDVVIPTDADLTLDLNGFTLTNVSDHTITNNGTLTIVGNGTVDNITHAHAAIMNNGTMTINGGTFTRSQETQDYVDDGADNSWYTVVNKGTMTINDGTFTTADGQSANLGNRSSLIRNGDATDNSNVTLAINGGTFTSGANVLKNEAGAVISSITGGVFTMDNSVISWSGGNNVVQNAGTITSITGGTFRAIGSGMSADEDSSYYRHGIWNSGSIANMGGDVSFVMEGDQNQLICLGTGGTELNITGGSYNVVEGELESNSLFYVSASNPKTPVISGGSFSDPVSPEYLDDSLNAELYSRSNSDTPYSYYSTVEDALEAAQPGDIVTDLSTVTSDTKYNVTFNYGNNDSATVSVSEGATITFTAPTRSGYEFRGWRDNSGKLHKAGDVVTVNSDMTFTAVWSAINIPDTYDIEIADAANGSVDTSLSNASAGSTITITATPDSGYSVASVTVTGPDGRVDVVRVNATTYTFKMPAGDVTVRVTFTDSDALPFTDVSAGQWFYDAVAYVYTNGMMEGDSATTFNPDGTMTRAMFWAVLGRIDGATITGTNWADQARDWAMAEGVSDGTDPNGLVTREQMVTMLWRYAGEPESSASLSAYTDADSVSDWAETAMRWAIDEGIITGMTDTTLVPQGTATRAQCAAIFMRFDQM